MLRQFPKAYRKDFTVFKRLNSPRKAQDFIAKNIRINFEPNGETCRSPFMVLKRKEAHCIEGAMLAAAIFWYHGGDPLLLDLKTTEGDMDHVVAPLKERGCWGAVSKTNHAVLRYRDPVYASVRELAMSYFHEYFLNDGRKTMRSYSAPFDMRKLPDTWLVQEDDLWQVPADLDNSRHFSIMPPGAVRRLRPADKLEREAGKLTQWKKK